MSWYKMALKHLLQPATRGQSHALYFNSVFVCFISLELPYGDVDVFIQFGGRKIFLIFDFCPSLSEMEFKSV